MNVKQLQSDTMTGRVPANAIDKGLLMIGGSGPSNRPRRRCSGGVDRTPNKPNLRHFWAKNEGGRKSKANFARRSPQIRDTRYASRDTRRHVASAPNKANPGRGGLGIDEGLWIIDDLGQGNGCRRMLAISTPSAPKKANLPRFWAENEGDAKNKANPDVSGWVQSSLK